MIEKFQQNNQQLIESLKSAMSSKKTTLPFSSLILVALANASVIFNNVKTSENFIPGSIEDSLSLSSIIIYI